MVAAPGKEAHAGSLDLESRDRQRREQAGRGERRRKMIHADAIVADRDRTAQRRCAVGRPREAQPHAPEQEGEGGRSEEHTSELQSLMRISYAVFCLKKTKQITNA